MSRGEDLQIYGNKRNWSVTYVESIGGAPVAIANGR